jgi:enamine deaminase RidA (YjgF/YER057c/UK114 family)
MTLETVSPLGELPVHVSAMAKAGDFVWVCGQSALNDKGEILAPGDMKEQTKAAWGHIAALLETEGLTLNDVASVQAFISDFNRMGEFEAGYAESLGDHRPSRTTVEAKPVMAGLLVEMTVVAVRQT